MESGEVKTNSDLKEIRNLVTTAYERYERISKGEKHDKDTVSYIKDKFMELQAAISDQRRTRRNWYKQ